MTHDLQNLMDTYFDWLREKTVLSTVGENDTWTRVMTPHLDRHNDQINFYIRRDGTGYFLTDDGATIDDLITSGCKLDSAKRKELLTITLNGFGVQLGDNKEALTIRATPENFPVKKHNLLQAMLAVNDMFYLAQPHVKSLFYEDVAEWLDESGVRNSPRVKFTGKSGYDHHFDFLIPKSKTHPERFLQTMTHPSKDAVGGLVYRWMDTRDTRGKNSTLYVMLNDGEQSVRSDVLSALENYEIRPVPWSARELVREELAA
jgi:hypothetical protein